MAERRFLELVEHEQRTYPRDAISDEAGEAIYRRHANQVDIEFPSPKTDYQWRITPGGWVGYIPVNDEIGLSLQPKVKLGNFFRMLEYAYRIRRQSLQFPPGLFESGSLQEYYQSLAHVLAKRVLDRARRGLYRTYIDETSALQYVRGRLDIRHHSRTPWDVSLRCHYDEHTADIADNQILAWTLYMIARWGICRGDVSRDVRRAYRAVVGRASLEPHEARACIGRLYHRLNDDYEPLHALCRFFLEHSGPARDLGDRTMLPFLADMARVFELFVAEWLKDHLPERYELKTQERFYVGDANEMSFAIDLVLFDRVLGRPVCVMDTKYKRHTKPKNEDFNQAIVYAESQGCRKAVLIYPSEEGAGFSVPFTKFRVRSMAFSLGEDLDEAGERLMADLLGWVEEGRSAGVGSTNPLRPIGT